MNKVSTVLRDWWRGYSDEDLKSARKKYYDASSQLSPIFGHPHLSPREAKAYSIWRISRYNARIKGYPLK